ncbi:unnamed protein product [Closterium sp. Naga37s-1]|nr:unnamed protein product [Closterium sp. Naga37s-1]
MQRGKAPLRCSRGPWQGGWTGGPKGAAGAEGFGGAEQMGAPGGVWGGGVAPGRGGGWGSLLAVCVAGAAGCAVMELGLEKGKEAAGVMADARRHLQRDWLLLRVECADVAGLGASIKPDDSGSLLKNRESGGVGGAGGAGGAGGGNQSNSSVVSHTSSEIADDKSSGGTKGRKRVVVLGSGWGAVSFLKAIDANGYDVTLISPRNFFLFTPLLPSVTTGVVEGRSFAEPIRRILLRLPLALLSAQQGSSARFIAAKSSRRATIGTSRRCPPHSTYHCSPRPPCAHTHPPCLPPPPIPLSLCWQHGSSARLLEAECTAIGPPFDLQLAVLPIHPAIIPSSPFLHSIPSPSLSWQRGSSAPFLEADSARFLEAECIAIDPASKTLSCRAPAALPAPLPPATLPPPLPVPTVAEVGGQEEGEGETTRGGAERKGGGASGGDSGAAAGGGDSAAPSGGAAAGSGSDAAAGNVAVAGGNAGGGGGESGGGCGGGCGGAREGGYGGAREVWFTVPYDMLVVAVGAVPNTFNVPGVQQHCHFLKVSFDHNALGTGHCAGHWESVKSRAAAGKAPGGCLLPQVPRCPLLRRWLLDPLFYPMLRLTQCFASSCQAWSITLPSLSHFPRFPVLPARAYPPLPIFALSARPCLLPIPLSSPSLPSILSMHVFSPIPLPPSLSPHPSPPIRLPPFPLSPSLSPHPSPPIPLSPFPPPIPLPPFPAPPIPFPHLPPRMPSSPSLPPTPLSPCQSLDDAEAIRNTLIDRCEEAPL